MIGVSGSVVAVPGERIEDGVLPVGVPTVRPEHERERRESVAVLIGERRARLGEELEARGVERLAAAHHDARLQRRPVCVQPACALDLSLQQRAIECVLKVPRAQCGHRLDDLQPTQVGRVAHRRSPVAAHQRHVQQMRLGLDDPSRSVAIVGADRERQRTGGRVRLDRAA